MSSRMRIFAAVAVACATASIVVFVLAPRVDETSAQSPTPSPTLIPLYAPVTPCDARDHPDQHGPENEDATRNWSEGDVKIACDGQIYELTGVIQSTGSASRQVSPAEGSGSGSVVGTGGGGVYGSYSSSFTGAIIDGKGFVGFCIEKEWPVVSIVLPGSCVVLKVTDTKGSFPPDGSRVVMKCRWEYEAIGAEIDGEKFTEQTRVDAETWEFDQCRMETPVYEPDAVFSPEK